MYILEKISQQVKGVAGYVAEELGVSPNTVHSYLKELIEENVIAKSKRGNYELVTKRQEHELKRSLGELEHDTYAYDAYVYPLVRHLPDNVERIWNYGTSEMVNNVIDHSGAESLYLFIEQNYLFTRVVLIDDGIGIFKKIKEPLRSFHSDL